MAFTKTPGVVKGPDWGGGGIKKPISPPASNPPQTPRTNPVVSTGGGDYGGGSYDHIDTGEIERRLREEEENRKKQLAEWYEQEKTANRNNYERTRNNMNSQYLTAERRLRNLYGNQITGKGLASRARNYSMWQNNTSDAMQDYMNNDSASLQKYNQNLADVARMNAQGWYNFVYPLWMQQYKYDQEMNYRKWMQQL